MVNIFDYLDYREYLEDFYKEKKRSNPYFSYQVISNVTGIKAKSFLKNVIDGKKKLSSESIVKMNKLLKLTELEYSYFCDIVAFTDEKKSSVKNLLFQKILDYNKNNKIKKLLADQYEFFNKWYNHAIWEIVENVDFKEDYNYLASKVMPPITGRQARESVVLLKKLRLIKKVKGRYKQTDNILSTGDEVRSTALSNYHVQTLILAGESIDTVESAQRDISNLVVGLSVNGFATLKKMIQKFRKEVLSLAEKEKDISKVYSVGFHLFPISKDLRDE